MAQQKDSPRTGTFLLTFVNCQQSIKEYNSLFKSQSGNKVGQVTKNLEQLYQNFPSSRWFNLHQEDNNYTPRTGHASVLTNNCIYLFGGIQINGNTNNDLYKLDLSQIKWEKIKPAGLLPSQRSGSRAVYFNSTQDNPQKLEQIGVDNGEIIIFGGYLAKDISLCNDLFCFTISTQKWSEIQVFGGLIPEKRTDHSMVKYGKFLYVFGGRGENKQIFNDLKRFNRIKKVWKDKGEGATILPRFGHTAIVFNNSMYIFGGWDGQNCLDDLFQYSFVTNIWYEIRRCYGERPSPRYRHDAIVFGNNMYIFGGVDQNQKRFNDLTSYNFKKREWIIVQTSGCLPSPRTFHKIVNKDSLLFLLGGFDGERKNDLHMIKLNQPGEQKFTEKDLSLSILSDNKVTIMEPRSDIDKLIQTLNEQVKELSKKILRQEDKNLCKICFAREIDTVLMECCHFVLCFSCTTNLKNCPICRSIITKVIKTYLY